MANAGKWQLALGANGKQERVEPEAQVENVCRCIWLPGEGLVPKHARGLDLCELTGPCCDNKDNLMV